MKTNLLKRAVCKTRYLAVLLLLMFAHVHAWGGYTKVYTLDGTTTGGSSGYDTESSITQSSIEWGVKGNTTMSPWRLGGKGGSKSSSTTTHTRTIYSKTAIAANVSKISITHGSSNLNSLVSMTVKVSTASNGSGTVKHTFTPTLAANTTINLYKPANEDWSNCYYLITYQLKAKGTSNQFLQVSSVELYKSTFTVSYDANGGSGSMSDSNSPYDTATVVTTLANSFTRDGFTFNGWNTASGGGGTSYAAGATFTISANTTLYAQWASSAPACSNAVALSKGSATNGTVNTISSASVETCSSTASDRRVTVTITPAACYDAPSTLTWTKSSGTVSASKQSGPTDNGNGTYSYVYQFAQNDNGAGTFGVTCTAKAAGNTVNFDAGPGSCATSSLTETCSGSGITLPAVTASGVCKGWTTFAGWATAAVSDSTTTSVTLYAAGAKFVPASNGQTLYAVYSKVKGGGGGASWVLSSSAPAVGDSIIVAYYTGSAYKYMKTSGADNGDLTVAAGVATPEDNSNFAVVAGASNGVSFKKGSYYLHLNSSAINVTSNQTNADLDISSGSSSNSFIIKRNNSGSLDRVLAWSNNNWTSSSSMNSGCEVYFFKRTTSTTYYCSDPNCCISLGSINGPLTMSSSTDGTVTISGWTYSAGSTGTTESNVSSYTVRLYKLTGTSPDVWTIVTGSTSGGASGAQGTRTGIATNSKSVTYSGLEYGATYKFTVQPIGDGSTYGNGTETAATSINSNALTDNKFLNKYSICIDDGTDNNYTHNYISSISSHSGSVGIMLNGNTDYYQYKLSLGGVIWWGNTGKMTSGNCSNWTFYSSDPNCKLQTSMAGTYTFALAAGTPSISVTYPSANQASGYKIYFDNSVLNWSSRYYRIGRGDHNQNTALTLVTGTDNFYYVTTPEYNNMAAWHIANNYAWSGSNSIYRTKTNAEQTSIAITNSIAFQQYVVTGDITIVPTTTHSTGGDDQNNNCEFYTINTPTSGMLTHTATVTAPTNGTITLSYTSKSGSPSTSTVSDLPHRTNLVITTTPATGYNRNTLTVNGAAFTSGNTHVLAADATIAATFSAKTYSITLDREGGTTGSTSVTMTYNSSSHTAITAPTKAGFEFAGWWSGDDGTGSMVMNASGALQANVAGYTGAGGIWTKDATCTLYAKWTPIKTFVPVTSSTTLQEDDEIIFYGSSNFMSTTQNENNRGVTTTGYTSSGSNYLIPSGSTVQIAKLEATEEDGEWLFNVGTNAYLHATTGNSNYLRTDVLASVGDNGIWTIAVDGSNNATITSKGTSKVLRYNSNSTIFSCYASGQTAPKLYYYRRTDPYATTAPESLNTTFTYAVGYGPSEAQALTIKGYNLTGSMTVACPSGYELSSTSATSGFSTSNVTLTKDAKNKVNATVYIRLAAGKSAGTYNQTLVISGGGITNVNVSLSGSVVAAPSGTAYVLLENEDDLFPDDHIVILDADGEYAMSTQASNNRTAVAAEDQFTALGRAVFVSGASVQNIVVESCDNEWLFKVGDNSYLYAGSSSANRLFSGTARDDGRWQITIDEGGIVTTSAPKSSNRSVMRYNYNNGTPMFNCYADATLCEDIKFYAKPSATANVCGSPSALSGFAMTYGGGASDAQTFKVKARNITSGNVTVTAPTGYEISKTSASTGYAASQTLTPSDNKVAPTTLWVRLKADNEAGTYEGNIQISATGATTRNIALSGTVAPDPVITLAATSLTPLVTSRNGVNIMATNTLTLNIRGARAGQTVSISGTGLKFYKTGGTPTHYIELTGVNALTAPVTNQVVYVSYNPTSAGTGAITSPNITVSCDGGSETFSSKIKVRNLPDAVAIVTKVNNVWQALPANIGSASNPAPVVVAVTTDGGVQKAYGVSTLAYKLWPVKTTNGSGDRFGTYSSPSALYADRVRFAGNSNKGLWANDSKSANTINNNAAITEVGSDVTTGYEWIITTTEVDGQFVYNLTSTHGSNNNDLRLYSNKWGTYGSTSGTNELYILPLVEVQDAALTVMEWDADEIAVSYPNAASVTSGTFKAMIDGGEKTSVTATLLGGDMYKLTGVGDLQSNPSKVLTLSMTESSTAKQALLKIPFIVTDAKTEANLRSSVGGTASIFNKTDVIVRDGGRLTTGTASGSFADLYIYPGGKVKISNNFAATNIYMRGGYSFLDSRATYKYPDLCVTSGTVTTAGVTYDLYIDNRYYYTFSMPYDVTLASVTDEAGNTDFPVWVKHYNGATRATGKQVTGWEWYGDNAETQHSFFAGIGYEITAKPKTSGRPIAIIRFPVKTGNLTTDAARSVGVAVGNYGYSDYSSGSLAANNVGWNFVGNPYLTEYKAGTASPGNASDTLMIVASGYQKHIDETTGAWDGTYEWKASPARFVTVPYDMQTDYHAERVADYRIPAFSAFFIQTTESGTFYMRGTRPQAAAVVARRGTAQQEKAEILLDVLFSGEDEAVEGKAGLIIHDKYEGGLKDFEDVEQWFVDKNELKTYTFADGAALAYNLTNEQTVVQPIPMGYIATVAGEHTYSLNEENNVSGLEHLWLTDYETGLTTDLLVSGYSFTTDAGRFDERFAISAELQKEDIVTGMTESSADDWTQTVGVYNDGTTLTLRGLPENSSAYVYDMTGKLIASGEKLHHVASFSIAAQGVYNIRVVSGEKAVTLRNVLH